MARKMISELEGFSYEERLKKLNLPTIEQRREREDIIPNYKLYYKMEEVDNEELLLKALLHLADQAS